MRIAALLFALVTCFSASAGWFSPRPQEIFYEEIIKVHQDECTTINIILDERSTYEFGLRHEVVIDFHGEKGKEIEWPIEFEYQFQILDSEKVLKENSDSTPLDHAMGANFGVIKAPKYLPINKKLDLKLCFNKVGNEFYRVYKNTSFIVFKSPYIWKSY